MCNASKKLATFLQIADFPEAAVPSKVKQNPKLPQREPDGAALIFTETFSTVSELRRLLSFALGRIDRIKFWLVY
jgi:hypothetical protein